MNAFSSDELWVNLKEQRRLWSFYYLQTMPRACSRLVVQSHVSKWTWIVFNSRRNNNVNIEIKTVLLSWKEEPFISIRYLLVRVCGSAKLSKAVFCRL